LDGSVYSIANWLRKKV